MIQQMPTVRTLKLGSQPKIWTELLERELNAPTKLGSTRWIKPSFQGGRALIMALRPERQSRKLGRYDVSDNF